MKLSPSLYAADPLRLGEQVELLSRHVASLHVDVMDGSFAPAFGLGERLVRELVERYALPVDVHLMVDDPGRWAPIFAEAGARRIAFQCEAVEDPRPIAADLRARGALSYLALQPFTPIERALRFDEAMDGVLLLTASAGGGAFDEAALHRIATLPPALPKIVDGGLEPHHFEALAAWGVELVVVGRTLFADPNVEDRALQLNQVLSRLHCKGTPLRQRKLLGSF